MRLIFLIAKWITIIGGLLYIFVCLFATIIVGAAGHSSEINDYSNIIVCALMTFLLIFSSGFQDFEDRTFKILNWLTIGLIVWVFINILNGTITECANSSYDNLLLITSILLTLVLFSSIIIGLIKNINKTLPNNRI